MIGDLSATLAGLKKEIGAGQLNSVLTRFADLILVGALAGMIGLMIVPLPTWLLDIFLTINITVAMTLLMVSVYISSPTQIASYPTLLLVTTLFRLSLDISATRLILLHADAGEVIASFGNFVVQGNFVVGAVIFLIITLVQFIVITKGAERVAEVSARFTLDAMPGKQMSIDADMRAGLMDFEQARKKREALGRESQFYGAMDGAMKFVKGDAIAGIVITLINIAGGLVIGIAMRGMDAMDAVQTFSVLTIGNGLVSQIPALLISISAGLVVTRVASETVDSNLGKDIVGQILAQPKAIGISSALLTVMAIVPGMPTIPFLLLAGVTGATAYGLTRAGKLQEIAAAEKPEIRPELAEAPRISMTILLAFYFSEDLTAAIDLNTPSGQTFSEMLVKERNSLYYELGVIFPSIQVAGSAGLPSGTYQIWLNEVPVVTGQVRTDALLVNDSATAISVYGLRGEDTQNPANGKPAAWIPRAQRQNAQIAGLQVWDSHEVLILHLKSFLRKHARDFIGVQEVQAVVDSLKESCPALVDEVVPKPLSLQRLCEILQRMVAEEVSIRDLKTIFQALSESARFSTDVVELTESVRKALSLRVCFHLSEGRPILYAYRLDLEVEELFRNSIRQSASGPFLAVDPTMAPRVIESVRAQIGVLPPTAQKPVIITDSDIRYFVWRFISTQFPQVAVISYSQMTPEIVIQPIGTIAFSTGGGYRLEST
jgi:type III secretion protein V